MSISKIFKLKLYYFFNKNAIVILSLNLIFIVFCFVLEVINIDKTLDKNELMHNYFINIIFYLKIFMTFLSLYLFSSSVSFKNDFLIYLLLPLGVKREKSIFITILINMLFIIFFMLILFIFFGYIGLCIREFRIYEYMIIGFIGITFTSIIYGLYVMILNQLINNYFVIVGVMTTYILSNNMIDTKLNFVKKIVFLLLPALNEEGDYVYNMMYLIILVLMLIVINIEIYKKRDLNF